MKKKEKVVRKEFTEEDLPHTRSQVFLTVYKTRAFFIFEVSLLLLLFCLPLFGWDICMRLYIDNLANSLLPDNSNATELIQEAFVMNMVKNGISVLLFGIAGIGFGGAIHAFQALVWNKLVVVSDFFDGMKKNIGKYILWGIVVGLSFFLFELCLYGTPLTKLDTIWRILVYGLGSVQLAIVAVFVSYLYLQNEYYFVKGLNLFFNSVKFTILSFFPMVGFILVIMSPYFLVFIRSFVINFVSIFLFLFLVSSGLIPLVLYADYQFDKRINKEKYPEIYDRGVYRK